MTECPAPSRAFCLCFHWARQGGKARGMGPRNGFLLPAIAILIAAAGSAYAQAPDSENESKILRCRQDPSGLYWLHREQLRERCGMWSSTYTVKTKSGEIERIVYSRYFVVTMRNGLVSSIRGRRQIFTGFKKKKEKKN
jgi:hypothetical protein